MGAGPDEAGPARSRAARGPSFCLARAALRPPPSWIPSRKITAKKARQLPLAVSIKVNPLSLPAKTRRAVMLLSRVKNAGTELRRDAERKKRNLHSKEGNTAEQNLGEMPGKAKIMNLKNCEYMDNMKPTISARVGDYLRPVGPYCYAMRIDEIYESGRMLATRYGLDNQGRAYNDGHVNSGFILDPLTPIAPGTFKDYKECPWGLGPRYWKLTSRAPKATTGRPENVIVTTTEKTRMTRTKTTTDKRTATLPGIPKKPGRPYTGSALTNAQRQAKHRAKLAQERAAELDAIRGAHSSTSDKELQKLIATAGPVLLRSLWIEIGRRKGWLK